MQRVAPLIKEAQEKLKGRPAQEIQQRTMAIYRENKVNMAAGCLPAIVQMAALLPLYQMILLYEYDFRQGTFFWIGSPLSHQHPAYLGTSLAAFDVPLFLLYLVSMVVSTKMTPPPADPQQAQQQKIMMYMMPVMFGWIMYTAQWPAAFTFYWLVMNIVSTAQQYYILKQHPRSAPVVSADSGKVSPSGADGGPSERGGRTAGSLGTGTQAGRARNGANGNDGKGSRTPGLDARARARRKSRR
jgi:YidC/Oxa1 family membrane protein insertase